MTIFNMMAMDQIRSIDLRTKRSHSLLASPEGRGWSIAYISLVERGPHFHVRGQRTANTVISLITHGRGIFYDGDERISLRPGVVYSSPQSQPIDIRCDPAAPHTMLSIALRGPAADDVIAATFGRCRFARPIHNMPAIARLWGLLLDEAAHHHHDAHQVCEPLLHALFALICRGMEQTASPSASFIRCKDYIDKHATTLTTLGPVLKDCAISQVHLSRLFRQQLGFGPLRYLQQRKADAAMALLASDQFTIAAIAAQLHYDSAATFSRAFKRSTGVAPSQFRH